MSIQTRGGGANATEEEEEEEAEEEEEEEEEDYAVLPSVLSSVGVPSFSV